MALFCLIIFLFIITYSLYSNTLLYYIRMVVFFFILRVFSRTVCVFKVKFELFPLVQFIFLFFCVSLNALDRENTLTNSDTHIGRRNLSFFCVCLSYIHTSYLFCTCALRVLLLLLSSLSFFFFFVLCCYSLSLSFIIVS
jgi:hypothetical protein